jgi:hypothetical protein
MGLLLRGEGFSLGDVETDTQKVTAAGQRICRTDRRGAAAAKIRR